MGFDLDGHRYEGSEPTGFDLYDQVWSQLTRMGFAHLLAANVVSSQEEMAQMLTLGRLLMAAPHGRALVIATLSGWTVDGQHVTAESLPAIYGNRGRFSEAGSAAVRVWKDAGFFHVAGTGQIHTPAPTEIPAKD